MAQHRHRQIASRVMFKITLASLLFLFPAPAPDRDSDGDLPPADTAVCEGYASNSVLTCARLTSTCAAGKQCKVKPVAPVHCTCD